MRRISGYDPKFHDDLVRLVERFHDEYLQANYTQISRPVLEKTISIFSGEPKQPSFFLVVDEKCVGVMGGVEIKSELNDQRFFQEVLWYIEPEHGHKVLWFLTEIQQQLKNLGFSSIIMSIFENRNSQKLKRICERIGFKQLETHYSKAL